MIKNYFKIAWRNLVKSKVHSFINIAGLSVGMAVAMLIGLWIWDEVQFDKSNPNYDRIAQVMQNATMNDGVGTWNSMPLPLGDELRNRYGSDFKYVVVSSWTEAHFFTSGDKKITSTGNYFEKDAPDLLSLPMIGGSRQGFKDPFGIFISASLAKTLFGDADPMNKLIRMDDKVDIKIAGVYADFPRNSSFSDLSYIAPWTLKLYNDPWIKKMANPWGNADGLGKNKRFQTAQYSSG
jgi:hypothetical protein